MKVNRRQMLGGMLGAAGLSSVPFLGHASENNERQFLFVFCEGGWDQCHLFAPLWGQTGIDMEANSYLGEVGNIQYVASNEKPSVDSFLRQYGSRTCVINGLGVRSLAHDTCLRLISAGTSEDRCNDWASIIASQSQGAPMIPQVVLSGPSYAADLSSFIGRVGESGQLAPLLESDAFLSPELDALEDEWLHDLHAVREMNNLQQEYLKQRALVAEGNLQSVQAMASTVDLMSDVDGGQGNDLARDLSNAVQLLSNGTARCVSLKHRGWQNLGYDSHASIAVQASNLQQLFDELQTTYQLIELTEPELFQRLTIVVLSEMGRFPSLNLRQGKSHWMHTSAILIGSGIRGDNMIGAYDSNCFSSPVDLNSGDVYSSGVLLKPDHLGATLLHLAEADPTERLVGVDPIWAALL